MTDGSGFTDEQKQYLEGFLSGVLARRGGARPATPSPETTAPGSPHLLAIHLAAQDRFVTAGRKLVPEEEAKRAKDPFGLWDEMAANAGAGRFPKGTDVFLYKFSGLFYVAPNQNAFMCRLRMPGGILSAHQFRGVADLAEQFGGGYADVTTRANLQIREIPATAAPQMLMAIQELGLTSRGAGADNIRNITGSPTAGIDAQELIDTRPLARELHHYILNHRELYGLPRKFNIAFDGGGAVSVLEDTNDIGFAAVAVDEGKGVPSGVYFRLQLGGITGHGDFARDAGVLVRPDQCIAVAAAVVRVFIDHGDRTDRRKARLKYVIDQWGLERYLEETEKHLPFRLPRLALAECRERAPQVKHGHIGNHPQRQNGLSYIGVALPVGRLRADQMRGLADLAARHGSGTLRLTVWQNLIMSDVPDEQIDQVAAEIDRIGLGTASSHIRGAIVACTGNTGCRFSATNTKGHALALAEYLESRLVLDQPINIHLTGCPNSCAQHAIADIGLLGAAVEAGTDVVEGYHVFVGGGAGGEQRLGREIYRAVPMGELGPLLESLLRAYLAARQGSGETFQHFAARHAIDDLKGLAARVALPAIA